jgi:hypothetical protein
MMMTISNISWEPSISHQASFRQTELMFAILLSLVIARGAKPVTDNLIISGKTNFAEGILLVKLWYTFYDNRILYLI